MSGLFVDTSGWANLFDRDEPFHITAKTIVDDSRKSNTRLVTTNYIVSELVAFLISPFRVPRPRLIEYVTNIKNSPSVDIVHIDSELDARGWDLLSKREDKDWSLVDCTSFVLMKDQRIESSLTSDHHFEQVGFVRLLK